MADFNLNIKAKELGKSLENMSKEVEKEFQRSVKSVAQQVPDKLAAEAQKKLNTTIQDYLKGIELSTLGSNHYVISLDGDFANKLESGWGPYDMRDQLLQSNKKVQKGPRAGQPWVQRGQDGQKYAHVPISKKKSAPAPEGTGAGDMGQLLRQMTAKNSRERKQKITSIFKDVEGSPIEGKAAVGEGAPEGSGLEKVTKFQRVTQTKSGKQQVESLYVVFRTISEKVTSGWQHRGFSGVSAFPETEKWVEEQLDLIIKDFAG